MPNTTVVRHPAIDLHAWEAAATDPEVLIADGHDIRITVRAGHLNIQDGPPGQPRSRKIPKLPRRYHRLLILAGHGMVTIEAMRWMDWAQLPWSVIDSNESIPVSVSGPQRDDARLLRAQSRAWDGGPLERAGLEIVQNLLTAKLEGQADVLAEVLRATTPAEAIREYSRDIRQAGSVSLVRTIEGQAASVYWQAWSGSVHVPYSPADLVKSPEHWRTFSTRTSLANDGYPKNNRASDPVSAMLNYVYRIGETEAVHACHAVGLHPSLGFLHADKQSRDSLALDFLEAIRPACDRIVLRMMDTGLGIPYDSEGKPVYVDRRWMMETREGVVRLVPPLTHKLAGFAAELGFYLRPYVQSAVSLLAKAADGDVSIPRVRPLPVPAAPPSSYRPARLRAGITADDLLPADVFAQIEPLIPPPPPLPSGRRRTGRAMDTSRDRHIIGALAAHELLGVPWSAIQIDASSQMCQARLKSWQWAQTDDGRSVWDAMTEIIQGSGYLRDVQQPA